MKKCFFAALLLLSLSISVQAHIPHALLDDDAAHRSAQMQAAQRALTQTAPLNAAQSTAPQGFEHLNDVPSFVHDAYAATLSPSVTSLSPSVVVTTPPLIAHAAHRNIATPLNVAANLAPAAKNNDSAKKRDMPFWEVLGGAIALFLLLEHAGHSAHVETRPASVTAVDEASPAAMLGLLLIGGVVIARRKKRISGFDLAA